MPEALAAKASRIRVGDPMDRGTKMGPLVTREHQQKVLDYSGIARGEDGLIAGGGRPKDAQLQKGFFVEPTMFADVDNRARIAQEEIFGPVLVGTPFAAQVWGGRN